MAIYKQALIKYFKSPSLWIVFGISILISVLIGVWAPNHFARQEIDSPIFKNTTDVSRYIILSVLAVSTTTSALCIFVAVFAAFSGAKLFKDEVEDGTFLTLLSKPTTRTRIIVYKWLALLTITIIYTFLVAISWTLATIGLDYGKELNLSLIGAEALSKKAWVIGIIMWGILLLLTMFFASVAILISTRLSTSATVGIVITIGVIIPTTGFITTTFIKQRYKPTKSSWFTNNASLIRELQAQATPVIDRELGKLVNKFLPNNHPDFKDYLSKIQSHSIAELYANFNKELLETKKELEGRDNILSFASDSYSHDGYRAAAFFDLNYQVQLLSNFASDRAIPDIARNAFASNISQINKPFLGYSSLIDKSQLNVSKDEKERIRIFDSAYARGVIHLRKLGLDMLNTTKWIVSASMLLRDENHKPFEYKIVKNKILSSDSATVSLNKNFNWNKVFGKSHGFNDGDDWKVGIREYINAMTLYKDLYENLEYKNGNWVNEKTKDRLVDKNGTPIKLSADKILILGKILNNFNNEIIKQVIDNIPKTRIKLPSSIMKSLGHIDLLSNFMNISINEPYMAMFDNTHLPVATGTYKYTDVIYDGDSKDPHAKAVPMAYRVYRSGFDTMQYLAGQGKLKSVEQKQYLDKHILLYLYLALTLVLVPLSILLILKKEFR